MLQAALIPFTVVDSTGEESTAGPDPAALARQNALNKARAALLPPDAGPGDFVMAADTVVATESHILGKPADREEALRMLSVLEGREHQVISAVALMRLKALGPEPPPSAAPLGPEAAAPRAGAQSPGARAQELVDHASTAVRFCPLSPDEMEAYLDSGEWRGKAGAYAIQGVAALFVQEIRGEYANVVGLPLHLLAQMLRSAGFDVLPRQWLPGRKQV